MERYIEASRKRCVEKGISPENIYSTRMAKGSNLLEIFKKNEKLLSTAAPFLDALYDLIIGSQFLAILCDGEGCILKVLGDKEITVEAFKLKMFTGAYMDENDVGTNAMSLAISQGIPIQVTGEEHFIKVYHKFTCSAAPIKDVNGSIIGVVDLTGYSENVHLHTLGMVVATASAIEKMLVINRYNQMLEISKRKLETIFETISSGILTSDLKGNITLMNKQSAKMFGYSENEMKKMRMPDLIQNWEDIVVRLNKGETLTEEDIYANARVNKSQYTITAFPINDQNNNLEEITIVLHDLKKNRKLTGKVQSGQAVYTFDKILGKNDSFMKLKKYAEKIADSKSTILITGESGTGKEIFAQAIHNHSKRKEEPFVAVNCGAIPATLIESELFGYEEGAFTGARKGGNAGKFELAEGGTIFLDEIGEMPSDMQIRLLRVIEEGVINRIGGSKQIPIDVRIMAATNKDLKHEIETGGFRKDLYFRINVLPLHLPPLREHRDDIPELVNYYMNRISKKLNKHKVKFTEEYMKYLQAYDWPGNIRELENVIELIINSEVIQTNLWNEPRAEKRSIALPNLNISLEQMEKLHITNVMEEVRGNITLAAGILDIGRNTLYRKIKNYGIDCSKFEQSSETEHI